jgi:hypothetical protein
MLSVEERSPGADFAFAVARAQCAVTKLISGQTVDIVVVAAIRPASGSPRRGRGTKWHLHQVCRSRSGNLARCNGTRMVLSGVDAASDNLSVLLDALQAFAR